MSTFEQDYARALAATGTPQRPWNPHLRYNFNIGDRVIAGTRWTTGHGVVVKLNQNSVGVLMETGEAKGQQLTCALLGRGSAWVAHPDDPQVAKWLARNPPPSGERAAAVPVKRERRESNVIGRNRKKLIDDIFSKVKKVTYYHFTDGYGTDTGETTVEQARKAFDRGGTLSKSGPNSYHLRIHSNNWYDLYT